MSNIKLVQNRNYFFVFSIILVGLSLASLMMWGLKPGLDFTGGSLLEVEFAGARPDNQTIEAKLAPIVEKVFVGPTGDRGAILKMKNIDEPTHQKVVSALNELSATGVQEVIIEKRFETIGPTISAELKKKSFLAVLFVILIIIIYIAFAFRKVSRPVSSWKYGVCAVIALLHDVAIPVGVFAVLGRFMGAEVDTMFVTAILTVMGFSVHDTIVVFDRIRENLLKFPREIFEDVANRSVNQTIVRSISTSLTVLLVLLATFFFGGESVRYFILTLIVGVVFGTYSSIFIASPLVVVWHKLEQKAR